MQTETTLPGGARTRIEVGRVLDDGPFGRYQGFVVSFAAGSLIIDGVDSQLLGIVVPSIMAEWAVPRSAFAPVLAAGFVGMMVGGAVAGIGDRIGRRLALIGSVLLFGVMTLMASMATGLVALAVLRFFVGVGMQVAAPNAAALVSEYVPTQYRAFAVTATVVCIPLGAMLAGLVAIPVLPAFGWRGLFVIGGAISIAGAIVLMRVLPESPRFLARHPSRWKELVGVLTRVGHRVPLGAEFVDEAEGSPARGSLAALFARATLVDTLALWSAFFFGLLAVYLGFNWIPSMLTGAGYDSTIASSGITAYNLGGVVGALTGGLAIRRFGSKVTMMSMAAAAAGAAMMTGSIPLSPDLSSAPLIVMLGVTGAFINAVQVTLYALAAHVYPTLSRATGLGAATSIGRLGAILSTFAGASALELGGHTSFFALVAAAMVAAFISLSVIRRQIPRVNAAGLTSLSPAS
jgi:AAHS family 4-hydroxybenzoate transporter-like MFS transporter